MNLFPFIISGLWLIISFIFIPHYIELSDVIESWFTYKGLVFYKDFASFHLPLGKLILQPIHILSGWDLRYDPFLGLVLGIGILILIHKIGKLLASSISISVSLFFTAIFYWLTATGIEYYREQLTAFLLTLSLYFYFSLSVRKTISRQQMLILGILLGMTELAGQVVSVTLAALFILILIDLLKRRLGLRRFIGRGLILVCGTLIPLFLLAIYFISKGALNDFFYYNIGYYFQQYSDYEKVKLLNLPGYVLTFYLPLITTGLTLIWRKLQQRSLEPFLITTFFLSLSTLPFTLSGVFHPHHLTYSLPVLAINAGYVINLLEKTGPFEKIIIYTFSLLFLVGTVRDIAPWYLARMNHTPTLNVANDLFPGGDGMYDAVMWVKTQTPLESKILVMGDSLFYLKSDRLPAIRTGKNMEYAWQQFNNVKREIETTPPDYWIIGTSYLEKLIKVFHEEEVVAYVNNFLNRHYQKKFTTGVWQIWERTTGTISAPENAF